MIQPLKVLIGLVALVTFPVWGPVALLWPCGDIVGAGVLELLGIDE